MSLRRHSLRLLLATVLVLVMAVGGVLWWWLRRARAPEAVRLLPAAAAVVYIDVKNLRRLGAFPGEATVSREPEYEQFVRETGFQFERDLEEAAFAVHAGRAPQGTAMDTLPADTRFSEIFVGRFALQRLTAYLKKLAAGVERYRDHDVYSIPHEGRVVRVTILGVDTVAVSNTDSPQPLHDMIDSYKTAAWPQGGPVIVRRYRDSIPLGSMVWIIARIAGEGETAGIVPPPFLSVLGGSTIVASVRPALGAQLRIEAFARDEAQAQRIAEGGNALLGIFRQLEVQTSAAGPDPDVKQVFNSIQIEQKKDRAILSAGIPAGFLKKLVSEPPRQAVSAPPQAEPTPAPKTKTKR